MEFVYVFRWCVPTYAKSKLNISPAKAAENFFEELYTKETTSKKGTSEILS